METDLVLLSLDRIIKVLEKQSELFETLVNMLNGRSGFMDIIGERHDDD